MANIIKSTEDLLLLKDIINYTQKNELSVGYLEDILKNLLPKDDNKLLTNYYVKNKGYDTALFQPAYNKIILSVNRINEWLAHQLNDFSKTSNITDSNKFRSYLLVFMISHEIEHAYQYLIGRGMVDASNDVLKEAYNGIYNLMIKKHYIIPRPITITRKLVSTFLYQAGRDLYLLERNANILGAEAAKDCALYNGDYDIYNFFDDFMRTYLICGYGDNTMGSIEETYRKILMYDKYIKFYHDLPLNDKEKVRYGFNINEETREKVLNLKMDI